MGRSLGFLRSDRTKMKNLLCKKIEPDHYYQRGEISTQKYSNMRANSMIHKIKWMSKGKRREGKQSKTKRPNSYNLK